MRLVGGSAIEEAKIKEEEFEKDDDSNFHVDFIHAASNLRAVNYRIKEVYCLMELIIFL
jgi:ubiquitin-activating enzyme E1